MSKKNKKLKKKKKNLKKLAPKKSASFWKQKNLLLPILCILAVTVVAFYPSLNNGFVNWDDDVNIYKNPLLESINTAAFWPQALNIFTSNIIGGYNPLSIFTFAVEQRLFGTENLFYWHLDNLILHLICVFLVYRIGLQLGLSTRATIILTALFAIHPMRVESVAWLTERKDVLFGSFYLGALFYYIKYVKSSFKKKYLFPIYALFILSLFSKIQAVSLPLSMLAVDYYLKRDLKWNLVIEKIPYFLLSLAIGILGLTLLSETGNLENTPTYNSLVRIFVGTYSFLIYLVKSIIPFRLSPLYPYESDPPWYLFASAVFVPAYLYLFYNAWKKNLRVVVFGLVFFVFNIFFLLQILGAGQGFLADRFTYIAYIGLFFIFAYYIDKYIGDYPKYAKGIMAGLVLVGITYSAMTYQQTKIWRNGGTLWTHVLKYYKNITLPYGNRANYYRDNGYQSLALADYSKVISLDPTNAKPFNSRARLYFNSNNTDTLRLALADYNKAIEYDGTNGEYFTNRGAVKARLGDNNAAMTDFNSAIQYKPDHAPAYLNRMITLRQAGQVQAALNDIQTYLTLKPYEANMWYESGRAKAELGRHQEAMPDLSKAITYNPNNGMYYYQRSVTQLRLGNKPAAKSDALRAQQLGIQIDQSYMNQLN